MDGEVGDILIDGKEVRFGLGGVASCQLIGTVPCYNLFSLRARVKTSIATSEHTLYDTAGISLQLLQSLVPLSHFP